MWDFKLPLFCVTVAWNVSDKAPGSPALQRLYSTFPGGRPGVGLLLLRAAAGLSAAATGVFYFLSSSSSLAAKWPLGLVLLLSGAASAAGFLTPVAATLIGACFLGIALAWIAPPFPVLHDVRLMACGMIVAAVALALLGPGAFSVDGRLFGRREIVIPPSSRLPKP
jgi:uncharacterized membrane protein YphA (DoxX/SURF4 family)